MSLNYFFNPRSVAVVGASNSPAKLGRQILDNIIKGGFKGHIYPINLQEKKIAKLKAFSSLEALPKAEMAGLLVVIAIPAPFVIAEIKKCVGLGVKNIIIITAGFKEAGETGKKLEAEIKVIASRHHLNILGPNCLGLINTWHKLNATFAAADTATGTCALLSQSGAIGAGALDWLKVKDFNFGYFISLGNKAVLDENEIIEYLATDSRVDLIIAYLEEIEDGGRFMEIISRLAKRKPVAILKAGTSAAGGKLALSHTGSLVGSAAAVKVGVERAGAIWLDNLEDMFNLLMIYNKKSWFNAGAPELHVITNAGGVAVLTADEISRQKLPLGDSQDLLGDADAARYGVALAKTLAKKQVNNLLVLLTPQTSTEPLLTAQAIVAIKKKYPNKLIMASFVGGKAVASARKLLAINQIAAFDYPEEAVRAFRHLIAYRSLIQDLKPFKAIRVKAKKPIKSDDYLKSFSLLKKYQIPVVRTSRYEEARLKKYKYPAVLKTVGPDFLHKTDSGGVIINLEDKAQLKATADSLRRQNAPAFKNPANYLVVQEQAAKFQEIILGFKRDAIFGPLLMVGWGGIYTEIIKDFKLAISDLNLSGALKLITGLKIYPILNGARGREKCDIKALAQIMVKLARLANTHPEISELDINPLFVFTQGAAVGDVRIIL
ncbi:MAG: acetate--CoA ligase family protein [Candidatus Falkowbacteria bacterium]|nr:acetate--CoA ligase family protein [Candidatus Falkowbacteria bacterium]